MFSLSCLWEYGMLTISICLKHSALETESKVMLSEEGRDMSYKTVFMFVYLKHFHYIS